MDQHKQPDRTTLLQSAWSLALSVTTGEYKRFVYLSFILSNDKWKQPKYTRNEALHAPKTTKSHGEVINILYVY